MASAVQQHSLLSPLPELSSLKSGGNHCDTHGGGLDAGDSVCGVQTPTSSADPASERTDPVLLLSRPVEGFNHPRQHLFTDRLLGRFFEDSSLDAETRKTSKCLAGRLGTAGSHAATRPSTTATAAPHLRSSHSPTATRRGRKRMQGSASARALGRSREAAGGGLAARKEQVEKEIQEQRALIEKLEGRVASLSGRGRRSSRPRASSGSPASEDRDREGSRRRPGTDDRPVTKPEPERVAAGQGNGDGEVASDEHRPTLKERPSADERREGNDAFDGSGRARTGSQSGIRRGSRGGEVADHGPNARRDSHHVASRSASHATPLDQQREEVCAVAIQRNVRGIGRRNKFLTLQAAREEMECHLQALVSTAATASAEQQQQQVQRPGIGEDNVCEGGANEGRAMAVSTAAVRLLETSRKDGLAKPPFEILRAMYKGIDEVAAALASFSSAQESEEGDTGRSGARSDAVLDRTAWAATMVESCSAAKEALDAIRKAVGADTQGIGEVTCLRGPASAVSPRTDRDQHNSPAGSGRAAAVAMASARGGLLAYADDFPTMCQPPLAEGSSRVIPEPRKQNEQADRDEQSHPQSVPLRSLDVSHPQSVPLRSLDVSGVAQLLQMHGFEEQAPGFVSQSVDGVMVSDPNLCEADFTELGLGGEDADAAHDCRVRMVSFFRRSQQEGVLVQLGANSSPSFEVGLMSKSNERHVGESNPDDRRENESNVGRNTEKGLGAGEPDRAASGQPASSEESSWRRESVLVNRQNQRVLAQITLDPSETGGKGDPASKDARDGRRLSVALNQGVVVTAGGREAGLIEDAADEPDAAEVEAAAEGERKGPTAAPSGETSRADTRRRRSSVGIPSVTLYREPVDGVVPETGGRLLPLPPDVTVTTADETINVFR